MLPATTPATDTSTFTTQTFFHSETMPAGVRATMTQQCPSGTTPIAGGVDTAPGVRRYADHVNWGDGASVDEALENRTGAAIPATIYARCAPTSWFPAATEVDTNFLANGTTKHAGGYTVCPSGSVALSAKMDWNDSAADRTSIDASGPTADLTAWFVTGTTQGSGIFDILSVDLRCIDKQDFPGAHFVQSSWKNTLAATDADNLYAVCPLGMTLLNGGNYTVAADGTVQPTSDLGYAIASFPDAGSSDAWTASVSVPSQDTAYVDAWCVPNQPPALTITGPPTYTTSATAQFTFAATDPASAGGYTFSYTCSFGVITPGPCTSPVSDTVSEGIHNLMVTATTSDGRSAHADYSWWYDHTAPTAVMTAPTAPFSLISPVTVGWAGSDGAGSGVSTYNARYEQAGYTSAFGTWQRPATWQHTSATSVTSSLTAGSTQCYSAQAVDRAGNQSVYAAAKCTAMPVDDAALTASSGWIHAGNANYWNGTNTTTATLNATLTLTGVHLDRVGIVADTCPTCGQVALFVGTTRIGTVNLHSTTTRHQVIRTLPRFTARTGAVAIKVLTSGKTVTIDGLAVSHR